MRPSGSSSPIQPTIALSRPQRWTSDTPRERWRRRTTAPGPGRLLATLAIARSSTSFDVRTCLPAGRQAVPLCSRNSRLLSALLREDLTPADRVRKPIAERDGFGKPRRRRTPRRRRLNQPRLSERARDAWPRRSRSRVDRASGRLAAGSTPCPVSRRLLGGAFAGVRHRRSSPR
jgi:hypothetical protein